MVSAVSALSNDKPIFLVTHPRSCSTAFERVFMNRKDLTCEHEPFGEAFYYGPERLSPRYEGEENRKKRQESGYSTTTYRDTLEHMRKNGEEGKRLFIKDMAQYLIPPPSHPTHQNTQLAPSVAASTSKSSTKNPTVLPLDTLSKFHFAFLIRHPRRAIPSYYRCCIPPLSEKTGFEYFLPSEAGFRELRELFEYLVAEGLLSEKPPATNVSAHIDGKVRNGGGTQSAPSVCVIDADDLLDHPKEVVEQFCKNVGLSFNEGMLEWGAGSGCETFDKWNGFHEDAIESVGLKPRKSKKAKTREQEYEEWAEKYGEEGAKIINQTAEENIADYEFLKKFKIQV